MAEFEFHYNKIQEAEVVDWLGSIGENVEKGDMWYYQVTFLYGIIHGKPNLIEGIKMVQNRFLGYRPFRYVYAIYETAYIDNGIHLSREAFEQELHETKKINDDLKKGILMTFELCADSRESITEDDFTGAVKGLVLKEKYKVFDKKVLEAVRHRKDGEIDKAEESLTKYLYTFKNLDNTNRPISLGRRSAFSVDNYNNNHTYHYETFSPRLNKITGGGWKGETWIVAGGTSDGKTQLAKELVYDPMLAGDNVLIISLEMLEDEMGTIFETRRAVDMGLPELTLNNIRRRQLTADQFEDYKKVVDDMHQFKNLHIFQPEGKFTMTDLESEIDRMSSLIPLDIVVVDYLELVDPDMHYESYRVRVKDFMRRAKKMATQKNIWMIAPHQISREGRKRADKRSDPYYRMEDLQESSGVEQNCTVMLWILQNEYLRERNRAKIGVAKNRMGRVDVQGWEVGTDWEHCRIYEDGISMANELDTTDWHED